MENTHRYGRIWGIIVGLVLISFPAILSLIFKTLPNWNIMLKGVLATAPMYWAVGIVEIFTYVPMLGAGGTYLSFVTGNITNLKLPVGLAAMENAKVRANTEEGEVISTIAIGVSSITTTVIIAVGVLAFAPVLPYIMAEGSAFKPAFDWVLPALFGALGASYFAKHWKLVPLPVIIGVIVLIFSPTMGVGTLMFVTIVAAVLGVGVLYKLKWL